MDEIVLPLVPDPRPEKGQKGITKAIIENVNADNPISWLDLAGQFHCKPSTIYRTIARLRATGRMPPSTRQFANTPLDPLHGPKNKTSPNFFSKPPSEWGPDDLSAIDKLPTLNADQRKKLLSAIGMRPSQGVSQASALKILDDMDRGAGTQVGPPPPLTEQQQVERPGRLMRAVGRRVTQSAMEASFEQDIEIKSGECPTEDRGLTGSPGDVG